MGLTGAIQESLITILCYSEETSSLVRSLVPLEFYDPYYKDIAEEACKYIDRYEKPPADHTYDIVNVLKERREDAVEIYDALFDSIKSGKDSVNSRYVIDTATTFVRQQNLKQGIMKAADVLQRGRVGDEQTAIDNAEEILGKSMERVSSLFDPGTFFSDIQGTLRFLDKPESDTYMTGIPPLDRLSLGPVRRGMHIFVAPPGRGKSWWLVNLGKRALMHRLKVVHITLEMGEDEVMQRYVQAMLSVSKQKDVFKQFKFVRDEKGRFEALDLETVKKRPAFSDDGIRDKLDRSLRKVTRRLKSLVVKEFPTKELTIGQLDAYLDSLEASTGMIPDLLIVDYADLMAFDSAQYRQELGVTYQKLRGVAMRRNFAVATASQSNRAGAGAKKITDEHIAEDYSKMGTADIVLTYNQTQDEHDIGLARLYVAKSRHTDDRFSVLISQNYALGQFCVDSVRMTGTYWDELDAAANGHDEDDE